jgi:hypothetical protein
MKNEQLSMKKRKNSLVFLVALICAALLSACDNLVTAPEADTPLESGYGRISVNIAAEQARTLLPETDFDYKYFFTKGSEAEAEKIPDNGSFILEIGTYTVRVEACLDDVVVATGQSESFNVSSGVNPTVTVELTPAADPAEKGTFDYRITYPDGADAVITLRQWKGNLITLGAVATASENGITTATLQEPKELEAGSYLLTVLINKGGKYAGANEAVHISPSVPTVYEMDFDENDLIVLLTITQENKDIGGVTAPVTGATPVTEITATDEYTGTVTWLPDDATFQAETAYTATITITAKTDYTLYGVAQNFFDVAGAIAVSNDEHSGVVTAVFPNYAISLSPAVTLTLPAADYGYGAQTPQTVTVTNTGNQPTGELNAVLSDLLEAGDAGKFTLTGSPIASIAVGGNDTDRKSVV